MNKALGIGLIVIALVLAIAPAFTDCQSQGRSLTTKDGKTVAMKCHWTGIAEIGAALPIGLVGLFNLRKQRKETSQFLAVLGMGAGALAILFPTLLIGVCAMPTMICNMVMRPTLIAGGILAIAASVVIFFTSRDPQPTITSAAVA